MCWMCCVGCSPPRSGRDAAPFGKVVQKYGFYATHESICATKPSSLVFFVFFALKRMRPRWPTQRAAMANAVRCDRQCSALRFFRPPCRSSARRHLCLPGSASRLGGFLPLYARPWAAACGVLRSWVDWEKRDAPGIAVRCGARRIGGGAGVWCPYLVA